MIDLVDGLRLLCHHAGKPARGNDLHLHRELGLDAVHDCINLSHVAVDDARLHALNRTAADHRLGRYELDARELCRPLKEGLRTRAQPRCNHATEKVSVLCHNVKRRRRSNVDHDQRAAVLLMCTDDIDNTVCTDGSWILVVQPNPRPYPGTDDERANVEISLTHLAQRDDQRRYNR